MRKETIPEVYKYVVDDVIANCSIISKKNISSSLLIQLRDLWLSKLEAKGDEYIDLNHLVPKEKTTTKISQRAKKNLPKNKCELVCRINLERINYPEIKLSCNRSMPILDDDIMPQNLQFVTCDKSDSVGLMSERHEEEIEYEEQTNKKLTMKCKVKSLIKTKPAQEICSNGNTSNVSDELPKSCTSPIDLTMEDKFKSNGAMKSDLSFLKSTRRVGKRLDKSCLKPTLQKCLTKKCKPKLKQQIPESTGNKLEENTEEENEEQENTVAKTKIQRNVNWPALLKNQFEMDLENIKEKQKYNYVYKNNESYENKLGYTPVKIILPQRKGYSIKQRTCIVDAPSWFLVGSRLPRLLSPLIKQVTDLTLSDAKSTLQQFINNYNNILQVDGAGIKCNVKSQKYYNFKVKKKSIEDTSDIDSNDDETDDEEGNATFQTDNNIMCKFSLIKHSKRNWSLQLHNGIVYVNNKVFMFQSAVGEVKW